MIYVYAKVESGRLVRKDTPGLRKVAGEGMAREAGEEAWCERCGRQV